MATTMVEVEGIAEWPKLFEFNRDKPDWSKETDGEYTVQIVLDDANKAKLEAAGTQKKFRTDAQGRGHVFAPTRPHLARNEWAGGAPKVAGPTGTMWNTEADGLIGNGSRIRVLVAIYDAGQSRKGTRLEAVQVTELVPYISEGGSGSQGGGVNSFFKDTTGGSAPSTPTPAPKKAAVELDEIPF